MATVATKTGKSIFATRLKGGEASQKYFVGWGLSNNVSITATANDIALFQESVDARTEGAVSLVKTSVENDTFQVIGTQKAEGAERLIREAGLFDASATKPVVYLVEAGSEIIGSNSALKLKTTVNYAPANNTFVQVRNEVLEVETGSGGKELKVKRAQNGSTAISTIAENDGLTQGNMPGPFLKEKEGAAIAGATLITHADIGLVTLKANDSIQWTWQIQFS